MNAIEGILLSIKDLTKRMLRLETRNTPRWVYLAAPLTSTDWDGDAHTTTAKTVMDLSALFAVPAGVKAVLLRSAINDDGSAASANGCWVIYSPNNNANEGIGVKCAGNPNDIIAEGCVTIPCTSGGDIYYQCDASGAGTLDIYIWIWGYMI